LARINDDLGCLGGLLKRWLTEDERTAQFGKATMRAVLSRIEVMQDRMGEINETAIRPRALRF
jgi:hypothetical protein